MTRVSASETVALIADPPWPHANGSRTNSGKSPKYPLMSLSEIAGLSPLIGRLAGDHAVLYLWATGPHLPGAIHSLAAWGFRYRSFHVWAKARVACGFWARSDAELVLIGERGRPAAPNESDLPRTIFRAAANRCHSSKPDYLHDVVERLWPESKKVELFARRARCGWDCFGTDLGSRLTPNAIEEVAL